MPKQYPKFLTGLVLTMFVGTMLSCATDSAPVPKQTSLSEKELAYYSDEFDKMREDLWDPVGYLYRDEQMQNFKQTDMRFDNGKLILRTETGSFSKGGLATKYAFRGDFDVQLDIRFEFLEAILRSNMDQQFTFAVLDKRQTAGKMNFTVIGLAMQGGLDQGYLYTNSAVKGKRIHSGSHRAEKFYGSLRISRTGKNISTFYKTQGSSEWIKMHTFIITANDMMVGFQFRNFFNTRTTIEAHNSISIEIDRFKINAAQQIIEEEI